MWIIPLHLLLSLLTPFLIVDDPFIQGLWYIIGVRAETVNNMVFIESGTAEVFDIFLRTFDHTLRIDVIMDMSVEQVGTAM